MVVDYSQVALPFSKVRNDLSFDINIDVLPKGKAHTSLQPHEYLSGSYVLGIAKTIETWWTVAKIPVPTVWSLLPYGMITMRFLKRYLAYSTDRASIVCL